MSSVLYSYLGIYSVCLRVLLFKIQRPGMTFFFGKDEETKKIKTYGFSDQPGFFLIFILEYLFKMILEYF